MKFYLHIGYPRTGTTTFQKHFFSKHPQINYLGKNLSRSIYEENLNFKFKNNINEIIDSLLFLNKEEYYKKHDYLLKKIDALDLSTNKINVFSEEFIVLNSIHYKKATDTKLETFLTRFEELFNKKKIDVYYLYTIRKQHSILSSLYVATTIGSGSVSYTPSELVDSLKNGKFENPRLKILMDGLLYYKLYKYISGITDPHKIKILVYEEFKSKTNKYMDELSEYLKIDKVLSKKLIHGKDEHSVRTIMNEDIYTNNTFKVLYYKIIRNLKSPNTFLLQFKKKFYGLFILLSKNPKNLTSNIKFETNNLSKKDRKKLIATGVKELLDNKNLIKRYYEKDLRLLQKEIKSNLDENDYF